MALRLVNRGEGLALEYLVNKSQPENLVLHLFSNDKTPADSDVVGDYVEATFAGYAAVTLVGANWVVTDGNPAIARYPEQSFECNLDQAPENIYGYYVTRSVGGELMWVERFGVQVIGNSSDRILVTPRIEARDEGD